VETHGASGRLARYLRLVLVAILAGCGSSHAASSHSLTDVEAAAHELLADVQAGRYDEACEAFTATALATLAKEPKGCPGTLLRAKPFLVKQLLAALKSIHRDGDITGDTLLNGGLVWARYENDRWHFEDAVW
jgi:hypothetical protein